MSVIKAISGRYLEARQPERFYRYPESKVISDPAIATGAMLGVLALDKIVTGGSSVGDYASVAVFVTGISTLLGANTHNMVRALDGDMQQIVNSQE